LNSGISGSARKKISGGAAGWLLLAVIFLAWGGALLCWFASDDFLWLDVSRLRPVIASFDGAAGVMNDFRPVVRVSFLIDWWLYGDQAIGWHITNLALHFGCAWLFWRLVSRWLGGEVALLAALLFAASPLLQENVIWVSGRSGSLSCLFGLVSLWCFARYLETPRRRWLVALIAADLFAFASYEPMIVLPLFHIGMVTAERKRPWRALGWLLAAHLALAIYRRLVLGSHISYGFRPVTLGSIAAIAHDYGPFLRQLLVPGWIGLLAVLALLVPRNRDLARAAGWALAGVLVVMLPYVVFNGVASRFFYHAMLGIALIFALAITAVARLLPRRTGSGVIVVLGGLLLVREIGHARAEARDWIDAGVVGQNLVAQIKAADPAPDPNALHVVLDLPALVGSGELFFTYPDRAIRRFSRLPFDALLGGHQITLTSGRGEMDYLRKLLGEEDRTRADAGMPRLLCLDVKLAAAATPGGFLHGAAACGLDVLEVRNGAVVKVGQSEFFEWFNQATKGIS